MSLELAYILVLDILIRNNKGHGNFVEQNFKDINLKECNGKIDSPEDYISKKNYYKYFPWCFL